MHKKRRWLLGLLIVIVLGTGLLAGLLAVNLPYSVEYTCSIPESTGRLQIEMAIENSLLSHGLTVALYTGDKAVENLTCADGSGGVLPVERGEDSVSIPLRRGQTVRLTYEVALGESGKHGKRGQLTDRYCVFDGGQAFLLPVELYGEDLPPDRVFLRRLSVVMQVPNGWSAVLPFESLTDVTWSDTYDLNNDSFAMGRFDGGGTDGNVAIHTLVEAQPDAEDCEAGIKALYRYYQELFGSVGGPYQVILLPPDEAEAVIGGAGRDSVCSTFDPQSKRDWELLSHRMFHSFFDRAFRMQDFHGEPLLWLAEGLSTYYENRSMEHLPEPLRRRFSITEEGQFTSLFNRYLYMKYKEPQLYSFAPMDTQAVAKSQARTEFLHYIQAPLLVAYTEQIALDKTGKRDALLGDLLAHHETGAFSYPALLERVAGTAGASLWEQYYLTDAVLPLWELGDGAYSEEDTQEDVRAVELQLGSWLRAETGYYPIDPVDTGTLERIAGLPEFAGAVYAEAEQQEAVGEYSPLIDALLRGYALRVQVCGETFGDPMARYRVLEDAAGMAAWESWVSAHPSQK